MIRLQSTFRTKSIFRLGLKKTKTRHECDCCFLWSHRLTVDWRVELAGVANGGELSITIVCSLQQQTICSQAWAISNSWSSFSHTQFNACEAMRVFETQNHSKCNTPKTSEMKRFGQIIRTSRLCESQGREAVVIFEMKYGLVLADNIEMRGIHYELRWAWCNQHDMLCVGNCLVIAWGTKRDILYAAIAKTHFRIAA